ncbi:hypothetical protein FAI40_02810 [Acetobacteraceae bacterium]|nr:hypothetical protein FAI40_02810 [Acetobacteraceae bacterium]
MRLNFRRLALYGSALGAFLGTQLVATFARAEEGVSRDVGAEKRLEGTASTGNIVIEQQPLIPFSPEESPTVPTLDQLKAQQDALNRQNDLKEWAERGNTATGPDRFGIQNGKKGDKIVEAKIWKKLDKWGVLGEVGKFFTQPVPEFWNQGTLNESFPAMNGKGRWCVEPMFFGSTPWGKFNSNGHHDTSKGANGANNYNNLWWLAYSITDQFEVFAEPTYDLNWNGGAGMSSPQMADLPFGIKYRTSSTYSPSLTLTLGAQAPTGKVDRLSNPNDSTGSGTWYFTFGVTMMYSIPVFGHSLVSSIWASANQATGDARIHGMSTYGTDVGFNGWASPTEFGSVGEGFEYGLTKKFGLALDLMGNWAAPTTVKGYDAQGMWSKRRGEWSDQFTVVPGVEYAFTPHWGVVAQVSVPVVGRNTNANLTPQMAVVAFY